MGFYFSNYGMIKMIGYIRFPGHKCDLVDIEDAEIKCPKCGNDMYTDGEVNFCGYCYTEVKRVSK